MIIKLDWPNAKLAPNRANGKAWYGVAAIKAKAREDAFVLAKNAAILSEDKYTTTRRYALRITFLAPDKRRRDIDGCLSSLKSALDGIALAMGVDDSQFRPIHLDYKASIKPGFVLVEVLA